jgi:hypothetical protein
MALILAKTKWAVFNGDMLENETGWGGFISIQEVRSNRAVANI